jgi:hypothetical protein
MRNVTGDVFPDFTIAGGLAPVDSFGATGNVGHRVVSFTNFDYIADFTSIRGAHTWKFGGHYFRSKRQSHGTRISERQIPI